MFVSGSSIFDMILYHDILKIPTEKEHCNLIGFTQRHRDFSQVVPIILFLTLEKGNSLEKLTGTIDNQYPHKALNNSGKLHNTICQILNLPSITTELPVSSQYQGNISHRVTCCQTQPGHRLTNITVVLKSFLPGITPERCILQANRDLVQSQHFWGHHCCAHFIFDDTSQHLEFVFYASICNVAGQCLTYILVIGACGVWRAICRGIHHHVNKKTELHYSCQLHECMRRT